jgi:hypothetical protein
MARRAAKKAIRSRDSDVKAMELIQKSGILNKSATLDQITALSMKLAVSRPGGGRPGGGPIELWTFISPNYIYTGDDPVKK